MSDDSGSTSPKSWVQVSSDVGQRSDNASKPHNGDGSEDGRKRPAADTNNQASGNEDADMHVEFDGTVSAQQLDSFYPIIDVVLGYTSNSPRMHGQVFWRIYRGERRILSVEDARQLKESFLTCWDSIIDQTKDSKPRSPKMFQIVNENYEGSKLKWTTKTREKPYYLREATDDDVINNVYQHRANEKEKQKKNQEETCMHDSKRRKTAAKQCNDDAAGTPYAAPQRCDVLRLSYRVKEAKKRLEGNETTLANELKEFLPRLQHFCREPLEGGHGLTHALEEILELYAGNMIEALVERVQGKKSRASVSTGQIVSGNNDSDGGSGGQSDGQGRTNGNGGSGSTGTPGDSDTYGASSSAHQHSNSSGTGYHLRTRKGAVDGRNLSGFPRDDEFSESKDFSSSWDGSSNFDSSLSSDDSDVDDDDHHDHHHDSRCRKEREKNPILLGIALQNLRIEERAVPIQQGQDLGWPKLPIEGKDMSNTTANTSTNLVSATKGSMHIDADHVDQARAIDLFPEGSDQIHIKYNELGSCYHNGKGTSGDQLKAKECFLKAIDEEHAESLFVLAIMVVDEGLTKTEKQTIEELIESSYDAVCAVHTEWFQWYSNKRDETTGQQGNSSTLFLDDLHLADATFLLARLLASTQHHENLRLANKLISKVKGHDLDRHELLAWLSILVEDLCKENGELSHVQLSREHHFDVQKEMRPIALIGQGQFGRVYLAWLSNWGEYVAIKFVDMSLAYEDKVLARNVVREQFTCQVLKRKRVKNTVKYLGYTDLLGQGKRGLVYELCADLTEVEQLAEEARQKTTGVSQLDRLPDWTTKVPSSLRSCVVFREDGNWTTLQVITMLRKAAKALLEVHKIGFIHRDIAPRNILCDAKGNVQLADFGWAKFVGSSHDDASLLACYGKTCFTSGHQYALAWWAPECFGSEDEGIDAIFSWQSDVYALGITMWQCFSHQDPFSHVQDPEIIKDMILNGKRPCLIKKPDVGGVLDNSTPDDLIVLIESCWKQNATDRVALARAITELNRIETNLQNCSSPTSGRRAYKRGSRECWHDMGTIYRSLKGAEKNPEVWFSDGELYGVGYTEALEIRRLEKIRHGPRTISEIASQVTNSLGGTSYDVFLVHAGEQKLGPVATMKKTFQDGGLRCFLDSDITTGRDPAWSMRFALATCRYAVIILSREFFTRRHPASELMYAFKRMQWIRKQDHLRGWNSLTVVLYNVTVEDYKTCQRADGVALPESLCSDIVLVEWSDRGTIPWYVECLKLREIMIQQDKEKNALHKWGQYLEHYSCGMPSDFPSADWLYSDVSM